MTTQNLRLKISSPSLKLKSVPRYGAAFIGNTGISITNNAGTLTAQLALLQFNALASFDPSAEFVPVVDANGIYSRISVATLLNNSATTVQVITAAGDVAVGANTKLLIMNRLVDANPSNIILPLSSLKVGKLKVVDFKGNAGTWNHTVKTSGADTFQGALTQWAISADGASIEVDPIPGTGYAV